MAPKPVQAELAAIEGEAIGWQLLGEGAYLHLADPVGEVAIITVIGTPEASMVGMNVLLVG